MNYILLITTGSASNNPFQTFIHYPLPPSSDSLLIEGGTKNEEWKRKESGRSGKPPNQVE